MAIQGDVAEIPQLMTPVVSKQRGLWGDAFRRLRRNKLAVLGLIILLSIAALVTIDGFTHLFQRYDAYFDQDYTALQQGPSWTHFFGTDNLGRDNWSRVLSGIRVSLQIGIGTQIVVVTLGVTVGAIAALGGRFFDNFLMRITDIAYAFPDILFIILMRAVLENRNWLLVSDAKVQIILAISLINWTTLARLVRGQMLSLRERDYVIAARAMGATSSRIVWVHMLPNTLGPVIVAVTFGVPIAIFAEAALGFIGFGIQAPAISLGRLVSDGYTYINVNYWIVLFPAAAIAILMLCFTFIGDGLRDALDPRTR
ncbi:MAG: ABC transporter permease [Chloroflexota bacterium]